MTYKNAVGGIFMLKEKINNIFKILMQLKDIKLVLMVESLINGYIDGNEKNKSL